MKKFFEKHDLVKITLLAIAFVFVLTWLIPSGVYQSGSVTGELERTGIADLFLGGMTSVSFFLQQILYLLFIGAFYGILIKTDGYKKLVEKLANKMKGHEIPFIVIISLIIAGFTSITTNVFAIMLFIPLIINIIHKMKLDNVTAFATTFGSILIGVLGATYGTEGLTSFVYYLTMYTTVTMDVEIMVRAGILLLAFILFNFFNITHTKKVLTSKKSLEEQTEMFEVEESKKKNAKVWPIALGFIVMFATVVLGFVDWQNSFGITAFTEFHTWLTGLAIGEHTIIAYILGNNAVSFGSWQLYHVLAVMGIVLAILAFIYRVNLDNMIEGFSEGVKKMMKPVGLMVLIYIIFIFMYWSPIVPTIVNWFVGDVFNPFLSTLAAAISSLFHSDFGYTGYALGGLLTTYDGDSFNIAYVIYTSINGLVSLFAPTSVVLMAGLSYCNISYKKWFSYIWKFLVGMLVCLLVIFALLTYL